MVYGERTANMTRKEHRRAAGAYKKHKAEKFKLEEAEDARKDLKLYKEAFRLHSMIFTEDCLTTKGDLDKALEGKSEAKRKVIIKQRLHIWSKRAGRKDAKTPFSRGDVNFASDLLLVKLKAIIAKYVQADKPRAIRAMVPWPSQLSCAKPMPTLGDKLRDALEHQRLAFEEDQ